MTNEVREVFLVETEETTRFEDDLEFSMKARKLAPLLLLRYFPYMKNFSDLQKSTDLQKDCVVENEDGKTYRIEIKVRKTEIVTFQNDECYLKGNPNDICMEIRSTGRSGELDGWAFSLDKKADILLVIFPARVEQSISWQILWTKPLAGWFRQNWQNYSRKNNRAKTVSGSDKWQSAAVYISKGDIPAECWIDKPRIRIKNIFDFIIPRGENNEKD